jgi:phage gp29-like protein
VPFGYALAATDWEKGGEKINGWTMIHPVNVNFDFSGNAGVRVSGMPKSVNSWPEYQFVQCFPMSSPGIPSRVGLMRSIAWTYFFKINGFRNWNRFLEKFGSPFLVATMPSSEYSDNAKRTKTLNDLKQMGSSGVAVKSEGSMIEIQDTKQGSSQSFSELSIYCDNLFTLAILGQLGTSAVSSGFSNGGAQSAVRTDLLHSDARMVEGCINTQILKPLLTFNGIDPAGWSFVIKTDPAEDDKLTAETWQIVSTLAGKTIDSEQLSERFSVRYGNELPASGERQELAMSDSTPNDIDMIVTKSIKSAVDDAELWATWSEPVAEMIREAFEGVDLENEADIKSRLKTVSDALPDMFEKMDSTRMEEHLQKALLAGKVEGYQMEGAK